MIDAQIFNTFSNSSPQVFETGRYACHCAPGFNGSRCEANIDDCQGHKCANGAACLDGINAYACDCPPGFLGDFCEKKIAFCSKEFNPCKNGE